MSNKSSLREKDLFYSESNLNHLRRGIEALLAGRGTEHALIEDTYFDEDDCNETVVQGKDAE